MNSITSISRSGMNEALTAMSASAANLAGTGTAEPAGNDLAGNASAAGSDLAVDLVGMLQAKNAFLANLAVFKTGAAMEGTLLDAVA